MMYSHAGHHNSIQIFFQLLLIFKSKTVLLIAFTHPFILFFLFVCLPCKGPMFVLTRRCPCWGPVSLVSRLLLARSRFGNRAAPTTDGVWATRGGKSKDFNFQKADLPACKWGTVQLWLWKTVDSLVFLTLKWITSTTDIILIVTAIIWVTITYLYFVFAVIIMLWFSKY